MPISEFYPSSAKPKPQSSQPKMDLTYMHDEFVELLWDNGPVAQASPSRPRKSSLYTAFPLFGSRELEKDGKDNPFPKIGHFKIADSRPSNFPHSCSSVATGINAEDDEIVPWINYNYQLDDPHHDDYSSEFLNEYHAVNLNSIHSQNKVPVVNIGDARNNVEQEHVSEATRSKANGPFLLLDQSVPSGKPKEVDTGTGNASKPQKESNGVGVMNFSNFTRPVALVTGNFQGVDRSKLNNKKTSIVTGSKPIELTVKTQDQESKISPKPPQEVILVDESKAISEGDIYKEKIDHDNAGTDDTSPERIQCPSSTASAALERHETDKGNEAVVASSSVCSGGSPRAASNDNRNRKNGKHHDGDESGYQSEDLEDDVVELKKPATLPTKSKKRSRAAEVHNLSERRRRDRINERMRALQELIPNCNKTDKASMLDEAIEYLKSLQMQLQVMAMGGALCMSPMMMRGPPMAHFSPIGMGMGMGAGLNYGMGMYNMSGSQACSFIPLSLMQGPAFPCPLIPGAPGLHRVPGPSNGLQMFGNAVQVSPMPMPHQPPSASATQSDNHVQRNES